MGTNLLLIRVVRLSCSFEIFYFDIPIPQQVSQSLCFIYDRIS